MSPQLALELSDESPYEWEEDDDVNVDPPPPTDWAHRAARAVLCDLSSRRGIGLDNVDDAEIRAEIVDSVAAIIRLAAAEVDPEVDPKSDTNP